MNPIDLSQERRARLPDYIDIARLDAAIDELLAVSNDISEKSQEKTGEPDPIAMEIWAYAMTLRRAILSHWRKELPPVE